MQLAHRHRGLVVRARKPSPALRSTRQPGCLTGRGAPADQQGGSVPEGAMRHAQSIEATIQATRPCRPQGPV
jgi:hypothetical protein